MTKNDRSELLGQNLRAFLGDIDQGAMGPPRQPLERVCVAAGETPMVQGDPGDSMHHSVSGRLRDLDGAEDAVRDRARRQIIDRLQSCLSRSELARPVTVALVPIIQEAQVDTFVQRPAPHLKGIGRVGFEEAACIDRDAEQPEAGVPGSWTPPRDRLRTHSKLKHKGPSLEADLRNLTIFDSISRQREKFDNIVKQGRAHGVEVLSAMNADALEPVLPLSMRHNPA